LTHIKQKVVIEEKFSSELEVTSGVPQASVLGATLVLIYIDDFPLKLNCIVSLYADITLVDQAVDTKEDAVRFQDNINAIHKCSVDWKMP